MNTLSYDVMFTILGWLPYQCTAPLTCVYLNKLWVYYGFLATSKPPKNVI